MERADRYANRTVTRYSPSACCASRIPRQKIAVEQVLSGSMLLKVWSLHFPRGGSESEGLGSQASDGLHRVR